MENEYTEEQKEFLSRELEEFKFEMNRRKINNLTGKMKTIEMKNGNKIIFLRNKYGKKFESSGGIIVSEFEQQEKMYQDKVKRIKENGKTL